MLQEKRATIGSYDVDIPADFIFIATMNPEDSSTEKLSDVLLDRFDVIYMSYPDDIEKEKTHKIEFQYGYGGHAEHVCKEAIGLKGFTSDLPIKFITIPNCKQRDVKNFGQ